MKYNLVAYAKDNENNTIQNYEIISFKNIYQNIDDQKLYAIDIFTSLFLEEDDLKSALKTLGLISKDSLDLPLGIIYSLKSELKLNPNIIYKNDHRYLNPTKLENYYMEHIYDKEFMHKFINEFNYLKNISIFKESLSFVIKAYYDYNRYDYKNGNVYEYMHNFITRYIYRNNVINYNNLRKLAVFIKNYENINNNIVKDNNIYTTAINHYEELLNNTNLDEEYNAYQDNIRSLKRKEGDD